MPFDGIPVLSSPPNCRSLRLVLGDRRVDDLTLFEGAAEKVGQRAVAGFGVPVACLENGVDRVVGCKRQGAEARLVGGVAVILRPNDLEGQQLTVESAAGGPEKRGQILEPFSGDHRHSGLARTGE